jgi:hypothetical protein
MRAGEHGAGIGDGLVQIVGAVGLTTLGAAATLTRWIFSTLTSLLPSLESRRPRHNAARVSEQVRAAKRAARKSGVLRP